jgi:hypothetical protein
MCRGSGDKSDLRRRKNSHREKEDSRLIYGEEKEE